MEKYKELIKELENIYNKKLEVYINDKTPKTTYISISNLIEVNNLTIITIQKYSDTYGIYGNDCDCYLEIEIEINREREE